MAKDIDQRYKYVRIQGRNLVTNTLIGKGVFGLCMELVKKQKDGAGG